MWSMAKHESIELLKSVKSILVLLFLLGSTYLGVWGADQLDIPLADKDIMYTVGLGFTIVFFGPLFAFILSHDGFNRDIEQRTMRFIVTKLRRTDIVIGKIFGHFLFWIITLISANILIFIFTKSFSGNEFFKSVSFILAMVAFGLMLSMLVKKTRLSSFISILLGILIPAFSLLAIYSEKWYISLFKYITPYYYMSHETMIYLVNFVFVAFFIAVTFYLFQRRDF